MYKLGISPESNLRNASISGHLFGLLQAAARVGSCLCKSAHELEVIWLEREPPRNRLEKKGSVPCQESSDFGGCKHALSFFHASSSADGPTCCVPTSTPPPLRLSAADLHRFLSRLLRSAPNPVFCCCFLQSCSQFFLFCFLFCFV